MITQMKKYTFLLFHGEYESFLHSLREVGMVHITEKAAGLTDDEMLNANIALSRDLTQIIAQVEPYLPAGTAPAEAESGVDAATLIARFHELIDAQTAAKALMAETEKTARLMEPWGDYSAERIAALAEAGYVLQTWTCSNAAFCPAWENATIVAANDSTTYFVTINRERVSLDAEEVILAPHCTRDLQKDLEAQRALLAAAEANLSGWAIANLNTLRALLCETEQHIDWQKVVLSTDSHADGALMLLEGFCPVGETAKLDKMLDEKKVYYQVADPVEEDNTPIQLRNNKFTKLFEPFTGMYGWPAYGEFDPTPVLAPFYLLFFSLCLGDAGYGIILMLFGWLLSKGKVDIEMFRGQGQIISVLGAGTLVIGLVLGTFFGMDLYAASWVPDALKSCMLKGDVMGFDVQMVASLVIGVLHICLAMVIKSVCFTKRYGFKENIGNWGWTLLIVGGIILAAIAMACHLPAEVTKILVIALGVVSGLGIFIFNKPGRNPLINIGAGLYDTYNTVSGLLSDVLSYVRLYALGLSGSILGSTFNTLGTMLVGDVDATNPIVLGVEVIFCVVILLFGHVLNILLSSLGAFVHPLRLTFVEYFKNAGYEGSGTEYKPFAKK